MCTNRQRNNQAINLTICRFLIINDFHVVFYNATTFLYTAYGEAFKTVDKSSYLIVPSTNAANVGLL